VPAALNKKERNEVKLPNRRKKKAAASKEVVLPFEQVIIELESRIRDAQNDEERKGLIELLEKEEKEIYENLSAWERVQLARHPKRPRMLDYTTRIFDDFFELHGDRSMGDDPAMIGGLAQINGQTVVVVGQQKGVTTEEKVERNFGMAHPYGYRKAMRLYSMAERFSLPVISFVDTPAAHPGVEAEQFGQGSAIAQSILHSLNLKTPIFSIVLSEGGSGGALAIAVGDEVAMFENAFYVICPPERCAEILWRDVEQKELASSALRLTATDLKNLGVIDKILPEPGGGAHRSPDKAAQVLSEEIERFLGRCKQGMYTAEKRQQKFQNMGTFFEEVIEEPPIQQAAE